MRLILIASGFILTLWIFGFADLAHAGDEVALFDDRGRATAYIAFEEESTIYLWAGKPVAYLDPDKAVGPDVYGFNGKHLGWFVKGVIFDHKGYGACAIKERLKLKSTELQPFKGFKEFKPFKGFKEFTPFRPTFSSSFGDTPCVLLLGLGAG